MPDISPVIKLAEQVEEESKALIHEAVGLWGTWHSDSFDAIEKRVTRVARLLHGLQEAINDCKNADKRRHTPWVSSWAWDNSHPSVWENCRHVELRIDVPKDQAPDFIARLNKWLQEKTDDRGE